jgi:plastocyanin
MGLQLRVLAATSVVAVVATCGCGGGSSSPTSPSTGSSPTSSSATINIVGTAGNQAFNPNPIQAASGTSVVWKNNTDVLHRIVMDNGTLVGDIPPGASSAPMQVGTGGNYHCANHPSMVGSVNGAAAPTPAPGSGDGY